MIEEDQWPLRSRTREHRDHVRAIVALVEYVAGDPFAIKDAFQEIRGAPFVARGIRRVDTQIFLQERGHLARCRVKIGSRRCA